MALRSFQLHAARSGTAFSALAIILYTLYSYSHYHTSESANELLNTSVDYFFLTGSLLIVHVFLARSRSFACLTDGMTQMMLLCLVIGSAMYTNVMLGFAHMQVYVDLAASASYLALMILCSPSAIARQPIRSKDGVYRLIPLWIVGLSGCGIWCLVLIITMFDAQLTDINHMSALVVRQIATVFHVCGIIYLILFYFRLFKMKQALDGDEEKSRGLVNKLAGRGE